MKAVAKLYDGLVYGMAIIAARSETYDKAFNDYTLPEAILRFRQGFGRLIRSRSDRGVVVILDRRLLTKQYGRMFLDSLPGCTTRIAPLSQLGASAAKKSSLCRTSSVSCVA